jgi:hypothetical protein
MELILKMISPVESIDRDMGRRVIKADEIFEGAQEEEASGLFEGKRAAS